MGVRSDNIIGTLDDDVRLSPGSPCTDAGDNTTPGLVDIYTDRDGLPRFYDDTGTPDSGNAGIGSPDIVDMGAYERHYNFDCNGNLLDDLQEVLEGWSEDCDGNLIPDECQQDTYPEGAPDGIPDVCDCDSNGYSDSDEIMMNPALDQNINGVLDICDEGFSGYTSWTNPNGGWFSDYSNWSIDYPSADNDAVFDLGTDETNGYTVQFLYDADSLSLDIWHDDVDFDLGGHAYILDELGDGVTVGQLVGDDANLTISNGMLSSYPGGTIAEDTGSFGHVKVSGENASWVMQSVLKVGSYGTGLLTVDSGGFLQSIIGQVGVEPNSFGSVLLTGSGTRWNLLSSLDIVHGDVNVEQGATLSCAFGGIFVHQDGFLGGDGIIEGNVLNLGDMAPGMSPGTMTIGGNFTQLYHPTGFDGTSGTLTIKMSIVGHDSLIVSGIAEIGGGLIVELLDGYEPAQGESFDVLEALFIIGQFDVALLPGLSNDKFMQVQAGARAGSVSLVVQSITDLLNMALPGELVDVTGVPTDVAVGDLDNNGTLDMAITLSGSPGSVLLLFNDGAGGFTSSSQIFLGNQPSAVAIGDLDTTPGMDVVVTNATDGTMSMLLNDGIGNFPSPTSTIVGTNPTDVEIADFDQLNGNDLVIVNNGDNQMRILYNDGNAIPDFETLPATILLTEEDPLNVDPVDVDKDKFVLIDLAVTNGTAGSVQVFQNGGAGTFNPPISLPVDTNPMRIESGDLDGNTFPDFVVTNTASGTVSIILNNGALSFVPAVNLPLGDTPRSVSIVDLDEDGDLDVAVVADNDLGNAVVMVLRNDTPGSGGVLTLTQADELGEGDNPVLVDHGDVDSDGDEDLVTINSAAAPPRNAGGGGRNRGLLNFMRVHSNKLYNTCVGDTSGDGVVDVTDLLALIAAWGPCAGCPADFNNDNMVDVTDLLVLIGAWGVCE